MNRTTLINRFSAMTVLLALLIVGCQGDSSPVAEPPTSRVPPSLLGLTIEMPYPADGADPAPPTPEARPSLWLMTVVNVIAEAPTWQEADARLRRGVAETPEAGRADREQVAAAAILRAHLLQGTPSPEKQAAIAYHVETLTRHRSPEAGLIADALDALPDVDPARRRAWAATAAAAAETHLARRYECEACPLDAVMERAGLGARADHALANRVEGVERLRALAR